MAVNMAVTATVGLFAVPAVGATVEQIGLFKIVTDSDIGVVTVGAGFRIGVGSRSTQSEPGSCPIHR